MQLQQALAANQGLQVGPLVCALMQPEHCGLECMAEHFAAMSYSAQRHIPQMIS